MNKIIVFDHDGTLVDTSSSKSELYSGMKELIESLKALDIKLFVWTARPTGSAVEILKSLGMISAFEEVYGGNELYPKPDIQGIKDLFGPGSHQIVMIGDSYIDMIGGKELKAFCIGACWDKNSDALELRQYGANAIAINAEDCLGLIKNFFKK